MHDRPRPPDHLLELRISFGDCDPAGIVYYPNFLRWFDRCFHDFLREVAGGHSRLCRQLGAIGLGLMDCGAAFRAPLAPDEVLSLEMRLERWSTRSLRLGYRGYSPGPDGRRLILEGHELRGVFQRRDDGRLTAAPVAGLRAILDAAAGRSGPAEPGADPG